MSPGTLASFSSSLPQVDAVDYKGDRVLFSVDRSGQLSHAGGLLKAFDRLLQLAAGAGFTPFTFGTAPASC